MEGLYQLSPTLGLVGAVVEVVEVVEDPLPPEPELYTAPLAQNMPPVIVNTFAVKLLPLLTNDPMVFTLVLKYKVPSV